MTDDDPQRYRVYDAEDKAAKQAGKKKLNPVTIRMMVQEIQSHPTLRRLFPHSMQDRIKIVIKGKTQTSAYFFMDTVFLPQWAHIDWVVCHEIAHLIDERENGVVKEGHGPQFCNIMLILVETMISKEASDTLRSCYEEHEIDYRVE